jgi:hypothetical protein
LGGEGELAFGGWQKLGAEGELAKPEWILASLSQAENGAIRS